VAVASVPDSTSALRSDQDKSLKAQEIQPSTRIDLAELDRPALEAELLERGHESFRARQLFAWIYRRGVTDIEAMTDLSRELRTTLGSNFTLTTPSIVNRERSSDGTEKFLLRLADGRLYAAKRAGRNRVVAK